MAATAHFASLGPFQASGVIQAGVKIYHYEPGTTTLKDAYTTRTKSATVAQPLVADANGIASAYFDGLYKLVVKDSLDNTLYTWDNWGLETPAAGTYAAGDTTPTVSGIGWMTITNASPTTITTFDDGVAGQALTVLFTDANTTIAESGNIKLSAAFTSSADDTMQLLYNGTSWFEVARSVN